MITPTDRAICDVFRCGLTQILVDDDGLAPNNDPAVIHVVTELAIETQRITAGGDTPEELLLNRLASITACLTVVTPHIGNGRAAVREWLIARSELFQLRIGAESW